MGNLSNFFLTDLISRYIKTDDTNNIHNKVLEIRNKLNNVNNKWIQQNPRIYNISSFLIDPKWYRYIVINKDIRYHILYLPDQMNSSKLYISLCGGGHKNSNTPRFLRWQYKNYLDGHYICIDDPMYEQYPGHNHVMWYYGNNNIFYLYEMIPLIKMIANQLSIDNNDIIFFGSSGGGTAAIHMANFIDNTTAYALNPQYFLKDWNNNINYFFLSNGIDLSNENDKFHRNVIQIINKNSLYFLIENINSERDRAQFIKFFYNNSLPIKYGLNSVDNIITWIHATEGDDPHCTNPSIYGFVLLNYIRDMIKQGNTIANINDFIILYNELLNLHYKKDMVI